MVGGYAPDAIDAIDAIDAMIKVRIAPSPTGSPHVGTAYIALFNYIFARKRGGKFILRIEDTDRKRLVPGAEKEILEALDWLGLKYDEGPLRQSERLELYQKYAQELVEKGAAYEDEGAVRQRIPKEGQTKFVDEVRGEIVFENKNLDESVLLKSDGYPTYHLGVVVDDHEMGITHVIRGEEWLSSVPKHILLYEALGWELPKFAHLPLLRDPERAKLGKRFGDVSLGWFKEEGFLPAALLNYLALLGWTHPEQKEIFDLAEMVEKFEFKDVNKAAPVFDLEKLLWMNGKYIRQMSVNDLISLISLISPITTPHIQKTIPLVQERMKTLKEFDELTNFFFEDPKVDPKLLVQEGRTAEKTASVISSLIPQISPITPVGWTVSNLEETCRNFVKETPSWSVKDLFMILRIALTGRTISPPLFETMEVLGREKTLNRLQKACAILGENEKRGIVGAGE
jgi:glutamyl-tRNA synthetase